MLQTPTALTAIAHGVTEAEAVVDDVAVRRAVAVAGEGDTDTVAVAARDGVEVPAGERLTDSVGPLRDKVTDAELRGVAEADVASLSLCDGVRRLRGALREAVSDEVVVMLSEPLRAEEAVGDKSVEAEAVRSPVRLSVAVSVLQSLPP